MARKSKELNSIDFEEQKQLLRSLIMDTKSWDKLDKIADKQNIFRILSIEHAEIRHSNFLAWVMDPAGNHKLGDYFLKRFLFEYAANSKSDIDVFDIDKMDLDDSIVYRELYHMDLIIESKKSDMVLVIENKIYADESKNQTIDYRKKIENHYNQTKNRFFVFLTLDETDAQDNIWVPMSHIQILEIVRSCIEKMPENSRGRYYLEDYEAVLTDMTDEDNSDIKKICKEIYDTHKAAIDLLVNNIPDSFQKRAEIIENMVKEDGRVCPRNSNNSYIRYTIPEI